MGYHSLFSLAASATTLLPGQDKSAPPIPTSRSVWLVVSCGFRLSEVGLGIIPKPGVISDSLLCASMVQANSRQAANAFTSRWKARGLVPSLENPVGDTR